MKKKLPIFMTLAMVVASVVFYFKPNNELERLKQLNTTNEESSKEEKTKGAIGYYEYLQMVRKPIDASDTYSGYSKDYMRTELNNVNAFKSSMLNTLSPEMKSRFLKMEGKRSPNARVFDPNTVTYTGRGPDNIPGRTREIVFFDDDLDTWWIGTVSGGLWKTEDAGVTWVSLSDELPSLATSFFAIPESNKDVIYVGLGEPHAFTRIFNNTGVYKSTNGGQTWEFLFSTRDFDEVSRVQVDPNDENTVLVATSSGLFRSTDGGSSFTDVSPAGASESFVQDLKYFEGDFNIQYTFIKEANTNPGAGDGIENNGVFRSDDAGATWTRVGALPVINERVDRGEIAISSRNPDIVYVSADSNGFVDLVAGSLDGGQTWEYADFSDYTLTQGTYDNTIVVHPFNDSIVYLGGVETFKLDISLSGTGQLIVPCTTTPMTQNQVAASSQINANVHVDHHNLKIYNRNDAAGTFQIIGTNDGGVSLSNESTDPGIGEGTWNKSVAFSLQAGQLTNGPIEAVTGVHSSQFYSAHKTKGEDSYVGGTQDNGSWVSDRGDVINEDTNYARVSGGDGFYALAHPVNKDWLITTTQFNVIWRTSDRGATPATFTSSAFNGSATSPFVTIVNNSQSRPDVVFAADNSGIWRSTDFGATWNNIPIVEGIYNNNAGASNRIAVGNCDADRVIAGTAFGTFGSGNQIPIFTSTDGGLTFSPKQLDINAGAAFFIQALDISDVNSDRIYVGGSVPGAGKVFKSNDYGDTWEDISGLSRGENRGFPDVGVFAILEMPFDENIIWVSTEIGVMQTVNGGRTWGLLATELPNAVVTDMKIVDNQVVMSTFGRGIWTATIPELQAVSDELLIESAPLSVTLNGLTSSQVTIEYGYTIDAYDSIELLLNGEFIAELDPNKPEDSELRTFEYDLEDAESDSYVFTVRYQGTNPCKGTVQFDVESTLDYVKYSDPVTSYTNDFESDEKADDFVSFGDNQFIVDTPSNLDDNVLHNADNPYNDSANYLAYLSVPIVVTDAPFKFNNIALVEAGDDFGDFFYDFVRVEASTDGETWIPVVDRYDQRDNPLWSGDITRTPEEDEFAERELRLNDFFEFGDVVALRFQLFSDSFVNGWGWAIDDIQLEFESQRTIAGYSFEESEEGWELKPNNTARVASENAPEGAYAIKHEVNRRSNRKTSFMRSPNLALTVYDSIQVTFSYRANVQRSAFLELVFNSKAGASNRTTIGEWRLPPQNNGNVFTESVTIKDVTFTDTSKLIFSTRNGGRFPKNANVTYVDNIIIEGFVTDPSITPNNSVNTTEPILTADTITVYPNPAVSILNITNANTSNYSIHTISGVTVAKGTIKNNAINVSRLKTGPYILMIEKEGKVVSKTIIKH